MYKLPHYLEIVLRNGFKASSPLYKCLYFGSWCKKTHIINVPARIGVRVQQPHDLETHYWIRYPVSEATPPARDL